jgi:hypothetical protein
MGQDNLQWTSNISKNPTMEFSSLIMIIGLIDL